ncbi:MAG: AtpZ/AtpI family protein [Armatimonadota bacterium]|nr:AtpZ/AtpI family protein [bacterium]
MKQSDYRWMVKVGPVWSIPFLIPISTGIGLWLGIWLDGKLGTKPWLAIVLTILGLASGIYESAKILINVTREDNND